MKMNKIILGTSLLLTLAFIGCGSSDDDHKVDFDAVNIVYKDSATIDLSKYIVSSKSQTNSYVKSTFLNDSGKKEYKQLADNTTYPDVHFDVNGSIIREYNENNTLVTTNSILTDRIHSIDAEDSSTIDIVRFADKGDYIQKNIQTLPNGSTIKTVCKVTKQLDSKIVNTKTYNDIIKFECDTQASRESTTLSGKKSIDTYEESSIQFFAKDIGSISSTSESCSKTTVDGKVATQECEKEIEEITSIH
jgi:hypothetical protein